MTKIIAANWKMNCSIEAIDEWFDDFSKELSKTKINKLQNIEAVVSVPSVYINTLSFYQEESENFLFKIAGQNCHSEDSGSYTGEVSAKMMEEMGCEYMIIGHSERRKYFSETNEYINIKSKKVIENSMTPIICIGESKEIRNSGEYKDFLENQLNECIRGLNIEEIIVAYEPIWAIGTGKSATIAEIEEISSFLNSIVNKITLLYGGSVNSSNSKDILNANGVNGLLIGSASLNGSEFCKIINS